MKYQKLLLIVLVLCCLQSFSQFRTYSNEFLHIGAGARGLGMGGAQVASSEDATAGYWNPAGMVYAWQNPSVSVMHAEYFAGIGKYDFVSAAIPMRNGFRSLGISAMRFAVDDIPNTLYLVNPADGSVNYNNIQTFSSADYAFLISYSQLLHEDDTKQISFGGNTKIIYRKVGSFANAWGFGFDAGLMIKTLSWRLGVTARDITTTFNAWSFTFTDREKEVLYLTKNDIPVKSTELTAPRIIIGGAYNFEFSDRFSLLAEANADFTFDGKRNTVVSSKPVSIDPRVGLEANVSNVFFVRAGLSNFQRALADGDTLNQKKVWIYQPALGAGFKIGNVAIDYAFTNLANQGNPLYTHIFSLRLDLTSKDKESRRKDNFPELPKGDKPKKQKGYFPVL
ncbi:PorV/PorQ family protein [Foetidibacter luteolus]|uniref:putative type IX sorting system protein PorV2 n=1 Tax=Foetidibacter luteolus TaxID=2608880 RepID=UPI00129AAE61|nr:PorV/PorQ family protein [Foetidibacter luteolus]